MMCHYYFATILFYTVSFLGVYLIIKRRFKSLVKYVITLLLAAGTVILVLPDIIDDILHSQSGSGNFAFRSIAELRERFLTTYVILNKAFWGGAFKIFAAAVFAFIIYCLIKKKKVNISEYSGMLLIVWTAVCYYVIGSATLTYLGSRYLSPIFSYIVLIIFFFCNFIIKKVFVSYRFGIAVMVLLFMLPMYEKISAGLVDVQKLEMTRLAESKSEDYCIFDASITIEENFFELEKFRGFMVVVNDMEIDDEKVRNADELVVYASDEESAEKLFASIRKCNPGLKIEERLYVAYYSTAYLLHK